MWDWDGDLERLAFQDEGGRSLRHQVLDRGWNDYWGHRYLRVLVEADVPACGYGTIVLTETDAGVRLDHLCRTTGAPSSRIHSSWKTSSSGPLSTGRACALVSLVDKASGKPNW